MESFTCLTHYSNKDKEIPGVALLISDKINLKVKIGDFSSYSLRDHFKKTKKNLNMYTSNINTTNSIKQILL